MAAPLDKPAQEERSDQARRREAPAPAVARSAGSHRSPALSYLWVGIGSALGGVARYGAGLLAAARLGESLPWGTILVNVSGSFVIGFFATLTGPDGRIYVPVRGRQFVMAGFCGGYTTFSSFALQTLELLQGGHMLRAAANVAGSLVLCLLGVWAGHAAAAALNR